MAKGVAVRIQPHVLERLKELGKEHCRTVSQTIEWLVKKYDEENSYEASLLGNPSCSDNTDSHNSFHFSFDVILLSKHSVRCPGNPVRMRAHRGRESCSATHTYYLRVPQTEERI